MFCIELGLIGHSQAEVEFYAKGRGLFDDDQPRADDGKWTSGGASASISDEPFALGQAKNGSGIKGKDDRQGSLFDSDSPRGAEARDLPGQTNFLGEPTAATKVGDMVKFSIPGPSGPMKVAGSVKRIMPNGQLEVKSQNHGYHTIPNPHPPEDTPETSGIDKSDAPSRKEKPLSDSARKELARLQETHETLLKSRSQKVHHSVTKQMEEEIEAGIKKHGFKREWIFGTQ